MTFLSASASGGLAGILVMDLIIILVLGAFTVPGLYTLAPFIMKATSMLTIGITFVLVRVLIHAGRRLLRKPSIQPLVCRILIEDDDDDCSSVNWCPVARLLALSPGAALPPAPELPQDHIVIYYHRKFGVSHSINGVFNFGPPSLSTLQGDSAVLGDDDTPVKVLKRSVQPTRRSVRTPRRPRLFFDQPSSKPSSEPQRQRAWPPSLKELKCRRDPTLVAALRRAIEQKRDLRLGAARPGYFTFSRRALQLLLFLAVLASTIDSASCVGGSGASSSSSGLEPGLGAFHQRGRLAGAGAVVAGVVSAGAAAAGGVAAGAAAAGVVIAVAGGLRPRAAAAGGGAATQARGGDDGDGSDGRLRAESLEPDHDPGRGQDVQPRMPVPEVLLSRRRAPFLGPPPPGGRATTRVFLNPVDQQRWTAEGGPDGNSRARLAWLTSNCFNVHSLDPAPEPKWAGEEIGHFADGKKGVFASVSTKQLADEDKASVFLITLSNQTTMGLVPPHTTSRAPQPPDPQVRLTFFRQAFPLTDLG